MARNRIFLFLVVALVLLQVFGTHGQDASIVGSPTTLEHSKDNVTIAWKGVSNPTSTDVITIHSPSNQSDWIGFVYATSASTWATGAGEIFMPLVNDRYDYGFKYWSNSTGTETLLAESNSVGFAHPNEPLQGHIQVTDDPTEMRVMWVSGTQPGALVKYGLESGKYTNQSTAVNSTTYTTSQLCDAPANLTENFRFPGYIHDALLTGLKLSTNYYYVFGSEADGWSKEFNFVTSPGVGADTELEFFVYGDMGTSFPFYIQNDPQPPAEWTTHWVHHYINSRLDNLPGLVLHIGDISYARGLAFIWDWFFDLIEKVATRVPYMVAIGNHEYDYAQQPWKPSWSPYGNDSAGECGTPYYARFHAPSPTYFSLLNSSKVTPRNLWYSFEMGPVHFTILSTETDFLEGSEQYEFIKSDLASVDRSRTPWLVFTGHRPMYTSTEHSFEEALDMNLQITYEPLFREFDVDVCFWGHVHTYERTCGMYNQTCVGNDNDAPVHIIVGNAGNLYQAPWDASPPGSYDHIQPNWDIFRTSNYGFGRVHANGTHFIFDLIGDTEGGVHDHLVLTK